MNRLEARTHALRERGACGIAPYITAGDGGLDRTRAALVALERAGAECVELGVPFSDPIADGPVLQSAAQRALEAGTTLERILACVADFRRDGGELPIALFSYTNPLVGHSTGGLGQAWDETCAQLAEVGVDGLLVPDIPVEQGEDMRSAAEKHGLCPVFFVSPTTSPERLERAAQASRGFLYTIGRTGITGAATELDDPARSFLSRVRDVSPIPIGVGFGLSSPAHVRAVAEHAELAIVGSALVQAAHEAAERSSGRRDGAAVEAIEAFVNDLRTGIPS